MKPVFEKKEYDKKYYQEHKERIKERTNRYKKVHIDKIKEQSKNYYQGHKEQLKRYHKEYRQQHRDSIKEYMKKYHCRTHYGLTLKGIEEILLQQRYQCKICGQLLKGQKQCIDHNHKTGKIRGILCYKCNFGLGHFNDDPKLLKSALNYVRRKF